MLRTSRTPMGIVWGRMHDVAIRLVAAYLARANGASVFAKGSFGVGDPVYGVSDIDLVVVVGSKAEGIADPQAVAGVRRRWRRLVRLVRPLSELFHIFVYDSASLQEAVSAPCFTFGLDRDPPRAAFLGPRPLADDMGLQEHPELYGAPRGWRRVAGPQAGIVPPADDVAYRRMAAWLELQTWWRYVFPVCIDPSGPRLPYLCVKFVAEPTRIWLWLARGQQVHSRADVLHAGLRAMPQEEGALRRALHLHDQLPMSPTPPLAEMLSDLVRLSSLIASEICTQIEPSGTTAVELVGDARTAIVDGQPDADAAPTLPLVDWRARTAPPPPDEVFALIDGDPGDPETLASAASRERGGAHLALRAEKLLILPAARAGGRSHGLTSEEGAARFSRVKLRGIQCPPTDPVSFAVAAGDKLAHFPNTSGWSARDCAVRAVAEHAAWLRAGLRDGPVRGWVAAQTDGAPASAVSLGRVFTAARAALFLESLRERATLAMTVPAVAELLTTRNPAAAGLVQEAVGAYAAWRRDDGPPPAPELVDDLAATVVKLPSYER